ncbi:MAG: 2-C-methyl-D-erythritol 4-phosphate cytidylyltransferase [Actinomycetota bacterium]
MEIWGVVVAGGTGTRFGGPKQLVKLGGRRIVDRSVDALRDRVDGVVVVGSDELGTTSSLSVDVLVAGGSTRSASVRAGLGALPPTATHVLIHDAARPLVTEDVVARVVDALKDGSSAVVPVIPVTDTLRSVGGGTVDRSGLVAVQTPQGFDLNALQAAHDLEIEGTDDASVVEAVGVGVDHVAGSAINLKITFPHDLALAEVLLALPDDQAAEIDDETVTR